MFDDPAAFLAAAGEHLAADPVVGTVLTTRVVRAVAEVAAGVAQDPRSWYAVARDAGGAVRGAAMRAVPSGARPVYVLPMPGAAARALARLLHERGEEVHAVNGALPAARVVAEETARLTGGAGVEVRLRTRLMQLTRPPADVPVPPGRLRPARADEVDLCLAWFAEFAADADRQAGRGSGHVPVTEDRDSMLRNRVLPGRLLLWEDPSGEVVHLTGVNAPALGVARIGPVHTPERHRGRGLAAAAVAEVSRRLLADGVRPCLFTDADNPVSNALYERLGFEPVAETADLAVRPGPGEGPRLGTS